jgi:hypothetical protein
MNGMRKFVALMVAVMTMASAGTAQKSKSGGEAVVHKAAAVPATTTDPGSLPGYLPVFDASGNLEDSFLFESGTAANPQLALGTTAPIYNLQFIATVNPASVDIDGYGNVMGINFLGRRAEGTLANPSQVLTDDNLMAMGAFGWFKSGTTGVASGFSPYTRASMKFFASQPWTDTAQGTYISLATTPNNTAPNASAASTTERMRIDDLGNVGIGTTTPTGAASTTTPVTLEVNGNVKLTSGSGGGIVFQNGTTQATAAYNLTAASGITIGGSPTAPTIAVNTTVVQPTVNGTPTCAAGSAVTSISPTTGAVVCGTVGPSGTLASTPVILPIAVSLPISGSYSTNPTTTTIIASAPVTGFYRVSVYMSVPTSTSTATCPSGNCAGEQVALQWNDGNAQDAVTAVVCSLVAPCASGATVPIYVVSGTPIQITTQTWGGTTAPTGSTPYNVYALVEQL